MMWAGPHFFEPIDTAPKDQGRLLILHLQDGGWVHGYWWRHWSMAEGIWWSPQIGVVDPIGWEQG